jgi:hypothetical protein
MTPLWQEVIPFAIVFVIYGIPILWVLFSGRSRGGAKFGWFIVVLMFSWLGFAVFLIATQKSKSDQGPGASSSGGRRVPPTIGGVGG